MVEARPGTTGSPRPTALGMFGLPTAEETAQMALPLLREERLSIHRGLHSVLGISFTCPLCSRIFLADRPVEEPIPRHLDALLGQHCPASGQTVQSYIDYYLSWEPEGTLV